MSTSARESQCTIGVSIRMNGTTVQFSPNRQKQPPARPVVDHLNIRRFFGNTLFVQWAVRYCGGHRSRLCPAESTRSSTAEETRREHSFLRGPRAKCRSTYSSPEYSCSCTQPRTNSPYAVKGRLSPANAGTASRKGLGVRRRS